MAGAVISSDAQEQFEALPVVIQARIEKAYSRLERWPNVSGAKPLTANLAARYRLRTGDYRVQFHVRGDVATIEKVGHRDGFYGE